MGAVPGAAAEVEHGATVRERDREVVGGEVAAVDQEVDGVRLVVRLGDALAGDLGFHSSE